MKAFHLSKECAFVVVRVCVSLSLVRVFACLMYWLMAMFFFNLIFTVIVGPCFSDPRVCVCVVP